MISEKELVQKFYDLIWNRHDKTAIPEILHESLEFRGSLGLDKTGHAGFIEYLDMVHEALGEYRCTIVEMVAERSRVFARMRFSGVHQGEFLGFRPTNRQVAWEGAALFGFKDRKISDIWVLGDVHALERQLS